jgi:regulator of PEP synthase PpsR (kinase-PPPase family)
MTSEGSDFDFDFEEIKREAEARFMLEPDVPDGDYAEFIINTARRTVKQENSLVRQIFYTAMSKDTADPGNLGIIAPTSEGKTYPVIEVLKFFPAEDVHYIGRMSTMTLVRQKGILVDNNNQPVKNELRELKKLIEQSNDKDEKESLEEELELMTEDVRSLIDLSGKIVVFLEPPHPELWNLIKPILSHDTPEIEFPFVDRTLMDGIVTKKVVVRGWPACIFCSAKDESNWPTWPEIVSRFLITSPNMIRQKYEESNLLIAQRKSLPSFIQQQIIVSDTDIELAKKCVLFLIQQLRKNHNQVWIPYGEILGEALKAESGTDSRSAKRVFSFLNVIPLVKAHLRPRLVIKDEISIIATLDDLNEALSITQNYAGIATNKIEFFKYDLYRVYVRKIDFGSAQEDGLTTKEMSEAHRLRTGRTMNSDSIRKSFLYELLNNGYVEEEKSSIDNRMKIYRPIVEPELEPEKIQKLRESTQSRNLLQPSVIILPRYCKSVPENWLIIQVLGFLIFGINKWDNRRISIEDIIFLDSNGRKQTITQFVTEYEYHYSLILYFKKAKLGNFHTTLFHMSINNEGPAKKPAINCGNTFNPTNSVFSTKDGR